MWLHLFALAVLQDPPPPVRAPLPRTTPTVEPSTAGGATLYDGILACRRAAAAYAACKDAPADASARADAALDAWQRGERSAAIGAWTRLALELEGATEELDLVAAALRLECLDGDRPTCIRRGFYSNGGFSSATSVRVRQLFDLPELAGRSFGEAAGLVVSVSTLLGPSDKPQERVEFPLAFDAAGAWGPLERSLEVGHTGFWDCWIELHVQGRWVDRFFIANGPTSAAALRTQVTQLALGRDAGSLPGALPGEPLLGVKRAFISRAALLVDSADMERSAEFAFSLGESHEPERTVGQRSPSHATVTAFNQRLFHEATQPKRPDPYLAPLAAPLWRTFMHGAEDVPAWILVPEAREARRPALVVLLHEPGFDEGWTRFVAGGGALFDAAARRGVVLLAPENAALAQDPSALRSLVAGVEAGVAIDRERLVLVAPAAALELARSLLAAEPALDFELRPLAAPLGAEAAPLPGVGRVLGLERAFDALLAAIQ